MSALATIPKLPVRPLMLLAAGVAGALVAAALALWAYYGTSVFYEMILNGFAACF